MQRTLITIGIAVLVAGLLWPWVSKLGLGRLPGDFRIQTGNSVFYFPLATASWSRSCCRWSSGCCGAERRRGRDLPLAPRRDARAQLQFRALTAARFAMSSDGRTCEPLPLASLGAAAAARSTRRPTPSTWSAPRRSAAGSIRTASPPTSKPRRAAEIREQGALDLADFMKRSLGSVFVNEAQSNPLQPDLQYRGFVGSPLLGLPQGLAVYQDGVRINEPFGDTVNWALIPECAIDSVYLMPGSNPLFGLNALGGAIAIDTKDGFDHAGHARRAHGGLVRPRRSAGRDRRLARRRLGYFVTASHLDEDGWRDFSPTEAQQVFAKLDVPASGSRSTSA